MQSLRASDRPHICIFRTDGVGDTLLTLPVAQAIKARIPDARVTMCVRTPLAGLISLSPVVDEVMSIEERDVDSLAEFAELLREKRFDAAIFAFPRPALARAARRAGIPVRVGTAYRFYSLLFTHRVREHRKEARIHEAEYNLHLLDPLGIPYRAEENPAIRIPDALARSSRELLARVLPDAGMDFVILHPGSAGSARDWSVASFAKLAARLRDALPDCALLLTGLATEKPLLDAIRADAPQACVFERELSLAELAGVIALGRCIVANSTGPLHVGAAVGTPVVGLYPNRRVCHPRRWGPRSGSAVVLTPPLEKGCIPCEKGDCETHDRMERILIDDVLGAVVRQVKGTAEVQTSYTDS